MRRINVLLAAVIAAVALTVTPAYGDATYHSAHIALSPLAGAPLRSGFVENIHANGPVVFAHELYVLNGAQPNVTYQVTLNIFVGSPTCSGTPITLESAQVTTNGAGNGKNGVTFTPDQAAPLRHQTHGIIWTLSSGGSVVYLTGCERVAID